MGRKILFIDRDGTIIVEPKSDFQVDSFEKLAFLPHALTSLARVAASGQYELVMVTNQDGLGTASFPEETFWPVHNLMIEVLESVGVRFEAVLIDRSFADNPSSGRKPGLGMLTEWLNDDDIDWANSWVIGDRLTDIQLAQNLGCGHAAWLGDSEEVSTRILNTESWVDQVQINTSGPRMLQEQVFITSDWKQLADRLLLSARQVVWSRHTKETKIDISLNLDGSGLCDIKTGLHFFDHMLEQIGRHGGLDLTIKCQGDLHIDEHHTIEDTGIALGEAIKQALGNKKGINRYAFVLPMDDVQAQVALDFGGRAWFVWDAAFKRDRIGDVPTEMFSHFFKSFSDASASNLQISITPGNEHHMIEAAFKGLAKCIKQAAAIDHQRQNQLPSTKGLL